MTPEDAPEPDRLLNDALAAHRAGRLEEAVTRYKNMLAVRPNRADVLNNLGVALRVLGRFEGAEAAYRRVIAYAGESSGVLTNLGNVLRDLGKLDEAETVYRRAVDLAQDNPGAWYGLGLVTRDLERLEESLSYLDRALSLEAGNVNYLWDRALTLLRLGRYREGFAAYECRWALPGHPKPHAKVPDWDGAPITGGALVIYGEQGFGDVIQFARFLPMAAARAGCPVSLEVRAPLVPLLESQFSGIETVIARDEALPAHTHAVSILSLPHLLEIEWEDVQPDPYLKAPPRPVTLPQKPEDVALTVAIAWAGSPTQKNDRNRSFAADMFAPLAAMKDVRLLSIQKGPSSKALKGSGLDFAVEDLDPELSDFAATAVLLQEVDLVISCDSAAAHLAGALGVPIWVALSVFHDWRYGIAGDLKPWYGCARVFKQGTPGDWPGVFARIAHALREHLDQGASLLPP